MDEFVLGVPKRKSVFGNFSMCKRSIYNTQCFDWMNTIRLLPSLYVFCIENASIIICLAYADVLLVWELGMDGYKTAVLAWRWHNLAWKIWRMDELVLRYVL